MIVTCIKGGLGNQLFQYAVARRLAEFHKTELKLEISWYKAQKKKRHDYLLKHFNIQEDFISLSEINELRQVKEKHYHFDSSILNLEDNSYLVGYWQSKKYFLDIESRIRSEFTFKKDLKEDRGVVNSISSSNSVSLHVRRTDYIHRGTKIFGTCSLDYYHRCLEYIEERFKIDHVFVFSDDPVWTRENLQLKYPITYVTPVDVKENVCRDFCLMSLCKYHILANSTFSWWAAWLCQRNNKVVLAPEPWFLNPGPRNEKDLIPTTWIRIRREK